MEAFSTVKLQFIIYSVLFTMSDVGNRVQRGKWGTGGVMVCR